MKTSVLRISGIVFLLLFVSNLTRAQENGGQTIKGRVIDVQSLYPLPGVTVVVAGLEPLTVGYALLVRKFRPRFGKHVFAR